MTDVTCKLRRHCSVQVVQGANIWAWNRSCSFCREAAHQCSKGVWEQPRDERGPGIFEEKEGLHNQKEMAQSLQATSEGFEQSCWGGGWEALFHPVFRRVGGQHDLACCLHTVHVG